MRSQASSRAGTTSGTMRSKTSDAPRGTSKRLAAFPKLTQWIAARSVDCRPYFSHRTIRTRTPRANASQLARPCRPAGASLCNPSGLVRVVRAYQLRHRQPSSVWAWHAMACTSRAEGAETPYDDDDHHAPTSCTSEWGGACPALGWRGVPNRVPHSLITLPTK